MKITQKQMVLDYWTNHKYISALEGFNELYIVDLAGVIRDLLDDGYNIHSTWVHKVNSYGKHVRFKKYYLLEKGI